MLIVDSNCRFIGAMPFCISDGIPYRCRITSKSSKWFKGHFARIFHTPFSLVGYHNAINQTISIGITSNTINGSGTKCHTTRIKWVGTSSIIFGDINRHTTSCGSIDFIIDCFGWLLVVDPNSCLVGTIALGIFDSVVYRTWITSEATYWREGYFACCGIDTPGTLSCYSGCSHFIATIGVDESHSSWIKWITAICIIS